MTELTLDEVKNLIKSSDKYLEQWKQGAPVEEALYIRTSPMLSKSIETLEFSTQNGLRILLDVDDNDNLYGIEVLSS